MKKNQKKKTPVRLVLLLSVLVAVIGIAAFLIERRTPSKEHMDLSEYFGISETTDGTGAETLAVIINGTVSEGNAIRDNGELWISYTAVQDGVNPRVYYDSSEAIVIVTTPTTKTVYALSDAATAAVAKTVGEELYVSESFLETVSDLRMSEYSDPDRLVYVTDFDYIGATVSTGTAVRYRAGIKSEILTELEAGETVRIQDVEADGSENDSKVEGWTYVTTESGVTGYVEASDLGEQTEISEEHTSPVGEYTSVTRDYKINLAFHQTTNTTANAGFSALIAQTSGVNTVAPTWLFLNDSDGTVISHADADYVTEAHNLGMEVWVVLNDFDGEVNSTDDTAKALNSTTARNNIIQTAIAEVTAVGADGINVDFERVTEDSANAFLQFIRELSIECRNRGLVLSIDNYVPAFTKYLNREEQGIVADYVVTMCYDENTSGAETAGSVASLPFVSQGISDTLKEVPAEKTIIAIPFYTRLWSTVGTDQPSSTACDMETAQTAVETYEMTVRWDDELGQNYAFTTLNGITYEMWLEDADSVAEKMTLIREADCAGVAEWKLGQETADIWSVISEGLSD